MYELYSHWSAPKPADVEPVHQRMIEPFGVTFTVEAGEEVIADLPGG